ncbi:hypothetical protein NUSPORA_01950 [Nucleospora cyclopteri]
MFAEREIVVDATGHIAGKLAACIAKKLLEGYRITVVSTEAAVFTGPLERRVGKYMSWKSKRCIVNPERGAFHYKEPSKYFYKVLRTMVPRKSNRGGEALKRLECYESIPKQFEGIERVKFPQALLSVSANPDRKSCTLGQLLSKFGWKHSNLSAQLTGNLLKREEEKRKAIEERKQKIEEFMKSGEFEKRMNDELNLLL